MQATIEQTQSDAHLKRQTDASRGQRSPETAETSNKPTDEGPASGEERPGQTEPSEQA
jgi:hypothetical protein